MNVRQEIIKVIKNKVEGRFFRKDTAGELLIKMRIISGSLRERFNF